MIELSSHSGANTHVIHGYGMGEVAVGCLIGDTRDEDGQIYYRSVEPAIEPRIDDSSQLSLAFVAGDRAGECFPTGDFASWRDGSLVIQNSPERFNPSLRVEFEKWGLDDWRRRTGYVGNVGNVDGEYAYQLRQGITALAPKEMSFYRFAETFDFSWLDKPVWS